MTLKHRLVAVALGALGGSWILYGGIVGLLPGMPPTAWLTVPLGVASLVIAAGIYLERGWARWPGITLSVLLIVLPPLAYAVDAIRVAGLDPATVTNLLQALVGLWIISVLWSDWPVPRVSQTD